MKVLTIAQAAYIAGLLDGEGYVGVTRKINTHYTSYAVHVTITMTNLKVINWLKDITGIGRIHNVIKSKNHKQKYSWYLRVDEIKEFLNSIKDYLIVKRLQASLLLEFLSTLRKVNQYNMLTVEEKIEKELIYEELRKLNKKGDIV